MIDSLLCLSQATVTRLISKVRGNWDKIKEINQSRYSTRPW